MKALDNGWIQLAILGVLAMTAFVLYLASDSASAKKALDQAKQDADLARKQSKQMIMLLRLLTQGYNSAVTQRGHSGNAGLTFPMQLDGVDMYAKLGDHLEIRVVFADDSLCVSHVGLQEKQATFKLSRNFDEERLVREIRGFLLEVLPA